MYNINIIWPSVKTGGLILYYRYVDRYKRLFYIERYLNPATKKSAHHNRSLFYSTHLACCGKTNPKKGRKRRRKKLKRKGKKQEIIS